MPQSTKDEIMLNFAFTTGLTTKNVNPSTLIPTQLMPNTDDWSELTEEICSQLGWNIGGAVAVGVVASAFKGQILKQIGTQLLQVIGLGGGAGLGGPVMAIIAALTLIYSFDQIYEASLTLSDVLKNLINKLKLINDDKSKQLIADWVLNLNAFKARLDKLLAADDSSNEAKAAKISGLLPKIQYTIEYLQNMKNTWPFAGHPEYKMDSPSHGFGGVSSDEASNLKYYYVDAAEKELDMALKKFETTYQIMTRQ